jgi:CRISPR-associated endoribonuclease Cas6
MKMDEVQQRTAPVLPVAQYRVRFSVEASSQLPKYLGSAVRGAFGHALKKAVCVTRLARCESCLLYRSCPYSYIFETPPPLTTRKMRLYTAAPHPFVFEVPFSRDAEPNAAYLDIGFTLFGRGNRFLPYMVYALEEAGKFGIGRKRIPFLLGMVAQRADDTGERWKVIYQPGETLEPLQPFVPQTPPVPDNLTLHFETPLRLRRDDHNVSPDAFRFTDLFVTLLRRISMLTYFHTDEAHETDFSKLAASAREISFAGQDLAWYDWTRYSSRQKASMQMGGLMGTVQLDSRGLEPFWPYIWLGQWTHVGKATSMGLGRYQLEMPASLRLRTAQDA